MRYFAMVAAGATLWGLWPLFLRQAGLSGPQNALLGAPLTSLGLALLIWKPGEGFSGWTAVLGGSSAIFFAISVFGAKEAAHPHRLGLPRRGPGNLGPARWRPGARRRGLGRN